MKKQRVVSGWINEFSWKEWLVREAGIRKEKKAVAWKKEWDLKSVGAAEKEIEREREREVIWEWMNK